MRGLFNLSTKSKEYKIRILSELTHEFEQMRNDNFDGVIKSYIHTLVKTN